MRRVRKPVLDKPAFIDEPKPIWSGHVYRPKPLIKLTYYDFCDYKDELFNLKSGQDELFDQDSEFMNINRIRKYYRKNYGFIDPSEPVKHAEYKIVRPKAVIFCITSKKLDIERFDEPVITSPKQIKPKYWFHPRYINLCCDENGIIYENVGPREYKVYWNKKTGLILGRTRYDQITFYCEILGLDRTQIDANKVEQFQEGQIKLPNIQLEPGRHNQYFSEQEKFQLWKQGLKGKK